MAAVAGASTASSMLLPGAQQAGPSTSTVADSVVLRLVPRRKKKSVKWAEDVDEVNEFSGKRKSKKCCIFHRNRAFGEWSDDEDSDAECDCGDGPGQPPPQQQQQQQRQGAAVQQQEQQQEEQQAQPPPAGPPQPPAKGAA